MLEVFFFLKSYSNKQVLNFKLFAGKSRALNGISLYRRVLSGTMCNSFDLKNLYNIPKISGRF